MVYRAVDPRLDRTVALKVLDVTLPKDQAAEYAARLRQEAKSAARLSHPNVITVFEFGENEGHPYLVLEYVGGGSLQQRLDSKGPLPIDKVIRLAKQLFMGLAYAHKHGVVHRDIKPANLLFDERGYLKIADFGVAQLPTSDLTRTGALVGSPRHMAPEQVQGRKLDGRADIFAAGVVLYEALTGIAPFDADHVAAIVYKILFESPKSIKELRPDTPPWLINVVERCLAKTPEQRFADADKARQALEQGPHSSVPVAKAAAVGQAIPLWGWLLGFILVAATSWALTAWLLSEADKAASPAAPVSSVVPPAMDSRGGTGSVSPPREVIDTATSYDSVPRYRQPPSPQRREPRDK